MKNWIIIVITLLLTALYVMSVQQALGGLRHLHRVEPRMMAPAEAQMAAIETGNDKHGATRVPLTLAICLSLVGPLTRWVPRLIGK